MPAFTPHLVHITSERVKGGERDIDVMIFHITTPYNMVSGRWKYLQYWKV
jgi:hypothetical protein